MNSRKSRYTSGPRLPDGRRSIPGLYECRDFTLPPHPEERPKAASRRMRRKNGRCTSWGCKKDSTMARKILRKRLVNRQNVPPRPMAPAPAHRGALPPRPARAQPAPPPGYYIGFNARIEKRSTDQLLSLCGEAMRSGYPEVNICMSSTGGLLDVAH